MSPLTANYQNNPFESKVFSRARKVVFALDQAHRFRQLDATVFAARISATEAAALGLSTAQAATSSALDQQLAATAGSEEALEAVRRAISAEYAVLKTRRGKSSSEVLKVFGNDISEYTQGLTHTNAAGRLQGLRQNLAANPGALAAPDAQRITDAIGDYTGERSTQGQQKGTVAQRRATAADAETALDAVLWVNQAALVSTYSAAAQQPQREAAANYSLLYRPEGGARPSTYADFLAAGATADVRADEAGTPLPAPATRLVLRNPGPVRVQVALSGSATAFPAGAAGREVPPGATLTLTLADLGDATALPFLLVRNPTSELGRFEITLG